MSETATHQSSSGELELSIILPCLNEAKTLATCLHKAKQFLAEHQVQGEIIVVDNNSTDESPAIAQQLGARVVRVAAPGYGNALMGGIAAAAGRYIIMGDADDSYDFSHLGPFLDQLRAGSDLVMGNRFKGGIQPGAMPPLNRYLGNPFLTKTGQLFFRTPIGDFYCGLRGFTKAAATRMNLQSAGMEFAIEMVVKATLLNMQVTEVPTTLSPDGRGRPSHLRPWQDGWRTLRFLLIYSPRWLFLYPGMLLMLLGLLVGAWLLPGPRQVGHVTYDAHTLLYAAMAALIGFQAMGFAVFTKVFAVSEGFLPEDSRLQKLFRVVTLEVGLGIGAIMIAAGLVGSVYAVRLWNARAFGALDYSAMMRLVIPSATLLVLGCQTVLSSFFISVLWLRRRRQDLA